MTATQTPAAQPRIRATVTRCDVLPGDEHPNWTGYVAECLAERFPGVDVEVDYGQKNRVVSFGLAADAEQDLESEWSASLTTWWESLCNNPEHPAWGPAATYPDDHTYRAAVACDGNVVLTRPEHADLDDEALIDEAMREAANAGLEGITRESIKIDTWTEE